MKYWINMVNQNTIINISEFDNTKQIHYDEAVKR